MLSIVVPTFNERENIRSLIPIVDARLREAGVEFELIVVDDASPDGTADVARELGQRLPVRVEVREGERGLSSAALLGFELSRGEIIALMDADHSHPPDALIDMHRAIEEGAMLVVGSRHVEHGGSRGWPLRRRLISGFARLLARGLTPVRDSTSGFMMFRREILVTAGLNPAGFKIGLELMVKGRHGGRVMEVPIEFTDRLHGESKLTGRVAAQYLGQLMTLYVGRLTRRD